MLCRTPHPCIHNQHHTAQVCTYMTGKTIGPTPAQRSTRGWPCSVVGKPLASLQDGSDTGDPIDIGTLMLGRLPAHEYRRL